MSLLLYWHVGSGASRSHAAGFACCHETEGAALRTAGEYNLRLGIGKEVQPELVATHQGEARVLEGHAFIVEAAVSLGGRDIRPGINVYRFANRIPLLFEVGAGGGRCLSLPPY